MNHPRILHAVFNSPWAIDRPFFGSIFSVLHSREMFAAQQPPAPAAAHLDAATADPLVITGGMHAGQGRSKAGRFGVFRHAKRADGLIVNHSARIHSEAVRRCGGDPGTYYQIVREEEAALPAGQIFHVFGSGVLGKHLSSMDEMCSGGLSVDRFQSAIRAALDDDKVSALMLHLDTPGGICYGMQETAALVRQAKGTKTVASFNDSLTASAGTWCVCCADYAYITPSADAGSIGVYAAHVDYVEYCKKQGIAVDLITDGSTYKGGGYPGTVLTEAQRAKIQSDVNACSVAFKNDVRLGRSGIKDETMQGQCFTGAAAVEARLADAVVNDLESALRDLAAAL
jgi:ClpP class serine protease